MIAKERKFLFFVIGVLVIGEFSNLMHLSDIKKKVDGNQNFKNLQKKG